MRVVALVVDRSQSQDIADRQAETGAALAGWFTLLFLSVALWWALGQTDIGLGWSAVIVALLWAAVAAVLGITGRSQLQKVRGMPYTVDTAKKVPDALKGNEDHA